MIVTGWLFDSYPTDKGITVWLIDLDGLKYKVHYSFRPVFYVDASEFDRKILYSISRKYRCTVVEERVEKVELYSNKILPVTEVQVSNPLQYQKVIFELSQQLKFYQFYNADIKTGQMFYYTTGLFPLAYGEFEIIDNHLMGWVLHDSFDTEMYTVPPLTIMSLTPSMTLLAPKYQRNLTLEIEVEGRKTVLEQESPEELLDGINSYLLKYDPDILLTSYGDAALLPMITALAHQRKAPLYLNRDATVPYVMTTAM